MRTMIAYCGLRCDNCPIHLATLESDKSRQKTMRKSIAKQCTDLYGMHLQPGDVNDCDGCTAGTGRLFSGCTNCKIRECASQKSIESCAYCNDYACEKLKQHFELDPDAQIRLEKIRQTMNK